MAVNVWVPHGASAKKIAQIVPIPKHPKPTQSKKFLEKIRPKPTSRPAIEDWKDRQHRAIFTTPEVSNGPKPLSITIFAYK